MERKQSTQSIVSPTHVFSRTLYNIVPHSISYLKKGWTDGEIGALWIKQFDEQTCNKANGHTRLLLVDGHNSHYTHAFLEYAQEH